MITRLQGKFVEMEDQSVTLDIQGIHYQVFVSRGLRAALEDKKPGDDVDLVTYHYLQSDPSRSLPILIGFNNRIEREFFEKFITVSGVGPKGALKAFSAPISRIAAAIDGGDVAFLKTLPGVGEQRAREIVAKLQGKVGRFCLIQDGASSTAPASADTGGEDLKREALAVLQQLQYRRDEAKRMVDEAFRQNPQVHTAEELLNEIYRQRNVQTA